MASLVKPWVVRYVDAAGKRCKSTDPGARQVKERAAKWHGQGVPGMPPRKRVPLATSKPVAQRMLDDLVRKAERGLANMADPGRGLVALSGLLDEYLEAVRRGSSAKHARTVVGGARGVFERAGLVTLNDLSAADVVARAEAAVWALVEPPASLTPKTAAYHGMYARSFTRWLWRKKGLLGSDPLAGMGLPDQTTERPRRHLTPDELVRLIDAAAASPRTVRHLPGPARAVLYLVAAATGLRAAELAGLTPGHFDLAADVPVVKLSPAETKNGKSRPSSRSPRSSPSGSASSWRAGPRPAPCGRGCGGTRRRR